MAVSHVFGRVPVRLAGPAPLSPSPTGIRRRGGFAPGFWLGVVLSILPLAPSGLAQEPAPERPELLVCAETNNLPFSARSEEGFENRLASLLAQELGLELRYRWMDPPTALRRDVLLERGDCDLVMAVAEGQSGYLTTIAYYLSRYVLIYREDAPFEIGSLDDPVLRDLRIGVQVPAGGGAGPPLEALAVRDLVENAVSFPPDHHSEHPLAGLTEAVAAGEVDVGIGWGPVAGYYAPRQAVPLAVVPIEPAFDPPFQPLLFAIAMGARPGDQALIDQLNLALARRWDEVQEILQQAHVPREAQAPPSAGIAPEEPAGGYLRIGLVVPGVTERSKPNGSYYTDLLGEAARRGAIQAEEELTGSTEAPTPKLLLATAPDAATAERAARRLSVVDGARVLVGGVGEGQAVALARVAEERGALFFNVGSPSADLRQECAPTAFHLQASSQMYLDSLVQWFSGRGYRRWYLLYPQDEAGEALAVQAVSAIEGHPERPDVVGRTGVEPGTLTFRAQLEEIRQAGADVVLLLFPPEDQVAFLSQQQVSGPAVAVAAYPYPEEQTRERVANLMARTLSDNLSFHLQLWDPALEASGSDTSAPGTGGRPALNERYASRWGAPMDPPAWAAYVAVAAALEAAGGSAQAPASEMIERLVERGAELLPPKPGVDQAPIPVSFGPGDHQLAQPLYVLELDAEAEWSNRVSDQLAIARPVAAILPTTASAGGCAR